MLSDSWVGIFFVLTSTFSARTWIQGDMHCQNLGGQLNLLSMRFLC